MATCQAAEVEERSVESSASAVEWAAIFGGALAAFGVTAILLTLGPGLGLDDGLSVVILQSITNYFWDGSCNMVGRDPMAVICFWRVFKRTTSDKMGWHSH